MQSTQHHEVLPAFLLRIPPNVSLWISAALVLVGGLVICLRFLQPKHHPQEPTVIPQSFPYIGHLVGIIKHGLSYYQFIHEQFQLPVYTLDFMSSKVYVVTSLEMTKAAQKKKSLSFTPFVTAWMPPLYGLDRKSMAIMEKNMNYEEGKFGYMHESYATHHGMLSPAHETLGKLTEVALEEFADIINQTHSVSADLHGWVRHVFTVFSTNAMWGLRNPFATHQNIEKDFWLFEGKFHLLLLDMLPKMTTFGAHSARENVTAAFHDYYKNGVPSDASDLVRERIAVGRKYGLDTDALARLDVGLAQAILLNTVPVSVWMLFQIFSSPSLLEEIRSEVVPLCNNGNIDPTKIRDACPLLSSTWQEVLRFTSYLPQGRTVLEDTMLDDRYLLTKGATVLIPSGVIHADTDAWGPDAAIFNPRRFMPGQKKAPSAAFRGFGGGSLMCPGRHFAATEVMAFVATMVAGFDIVPKDGKSWVVPERDTFNPSLGVLKPVEGREVCIERRRGRENVMWSFSREDVDVSEVGMAI